MKRFVTVFVILLAAAFGQGRHKLGEVNAETPEGQLLQQIGQEADPAKRLEKLNEFIAKFPKHDAAGWVQGQMHDAYVKTNQPAKILETGEKLLALDPEDVEIAHASLKVAEASKDPDLIRKWAVATSESARKAAVSKKPEDEDEVADWKRRVDFAKQVDTYTEYSLHAAALSLADPAKMVELINALEQRNPQSQYLPQLHKHLFRVYLQVSDAAKAVAVAEKELVRDPTDEDMLLVTADYYFNQKNADKALDFSAKLVTLMASKPAPQGVSAEDWEKKKKRSTGLGLWMQGVTYSTQNKFPLADKTLRETLPYINDNDQYLAAAYFYLGLANFRLGDSKKAPDTQRILDAIRFNQQCAAIKSPYQSQAQKNVAAIRAQYRVQ